MKVCRRLFKSSALFCVVQRCSAVFTTERAKHITCLLERKYSNVCIFCYLIAKLRGQCTFCTWIFVTFLWLLLSGEVVKHTSIYHHLTTTVRHISHLPPKGLFPLMLYLLINLRPVQVLYLVGETIMWFTIIRLLNVTFVQIRLLMGYKKTPNNVHSL